MLLGQSQGPVQNGQAFLSSIPFPCVPHTPVHTQTHNPHSSRKNNFPPNHLLWLPQQPLQPSSQLNKFKETPEYFPALFSLEEQSLDGVKMAQRVACSEDSGKRALKDTRPALGRAMVEKGLLKYLEWLTRQRSDCTWTPSLDPAGCRVLGGKDGCVQSLSCWYPSANLYACFLSPPQGWQV